MYSVTIYNYWKEGLVGLAGAPVAIKIYLFMQILVIWRRSEYSDETYTGFILMNFIGCICWMLLITLRVGSVLQWYNETECIFEFEKIVIASSFWISRIDIPCHNEHIISQPPPKFCCFSSNRLQKTKIAEWITFFFHISSICHHQIRYGYLSAYNWAV